MTLCKNIAVFTALVAFVGDVPLEGKILMCHIDKKKDGSIKIYRPL